MRFKKTYFIYLLFVFPCIYGQSIEVIPHNNSFVFKGDLSFIVCETKIKNISTNMSDSIIYWKRTNNIPSQWYISVCDIMNCWMPFVDSSSFVMRQGESGLFDINVYPNDQEGNGEVNLFIYFKNKKNEGQNLSFKIEALKVGLLELSDLKLSIFPIPARDFITIQAKEINNLSLQIINSKGYLTESKIFNSDVDLDIRRYSTGIYYVIIDGKNAGKFIKE